MLRAKCMKARSIRAGSNPAGSRGADQGAKDTTKMKKKIQLVLYWERSCGRSEMITMTITQAQLLIAGGP